MFVVSDSQDMQLKLRQHEPPTFPSLQGTKLSENEDGATSGPTSKECRAPMRCLQSRFDLCAQQYHTVLHNTTTSAADTN